MEEIIECPNCESKVFSLFISCTDFTVTKEIFPIKSCDTCSFKFTSPRPSKNEIGKYYESEDYISHSNTSKGLINKIYHFVKKRAIKRKIDLIENLNPKYRNVLDIGAGTGSFLSALNQEGWVVNGVEPNKKAREFANNSYNLNIKETSNELPPDTFGVITMWHVLEHVHELNAQIETLFNLLKTDGYVIIAVPNFTSWDSKKYKEFWAAYDVPRHLYHFSPEVMKELFNKYNLKHIRSLPMKMDSFYVSMLSEKYKGSSFQYFRAFWNGLLSNMKANGNAELYSSVIYIFQK